MTYQEAVSYLYEQTPMFHNLGVGAYKEGLSTTLALDEHLGHPHSRYRTIHVAGTNGKGSTCHTLAAILQSAGYRTGLYTSPHLLDFRERIRVDGKPISEQAVTAFIDGHRSFFEPLHPSFFELATAMAFKYFADQEVDVAVIEVGLGGRLDCTNIIRPDLSIITNIGYDHVALLGDTLQQIASEKAGIIKRSVPVLIGEDCPETRPVFQAKADAAGAPIRFAGDSPQILSVDRSNIGSTIYQTLKYPGLKGGLTGWCQEKNTNTILQATDLLQELGYNLPESAVRKGFSDVCSLTGLMGRWQMLASGPATVCDTGHNSHGLRYIASQLEQIAARPGAGTLRIVFGMVNDKDTDKVLELMPKNARYYFAQASVKRALQSDTLRQMAAATGLTGDCYPDVASAYNAARNDSCPNDFIFVGGSTFVVADALKCTGF